MHMINLKSSCRLKSIKISVKGEDSLDAPQISYCHAKLIDRDQIRGNLLSDGGAHERFV